MRTVKMALFALAVILAGCEDKPTDPLKPKVPASALIAAA